MMGRNQDADNDNDMRKEYDQLTDKVSEKVTRGLKDYIEGRQISGGENDANSSSGTNSRRMPI
jgi:hypothetical protein